jgi:hypothetical protein
MGGLVPFVGSGLSVFAGYPDWSNMLKEMAHELSSEIYGEVCNYVDSYDFYKAGDILCNNMQKIMILALLKNRFEKGKIKRFPRHRFEEQAVWLIPTLFKGKNICLTTNFDIVLEEVYIRHGFSCVPVVPSETIKMAEAIRDGKPVIIKLHGGIDSEKTNIILSNVDAEKQYASGSYLTICLESNISGESLLFLGASLRKDYTVKKLEQLNDRSNVHYAILPAVDQEEAKSRAKELNLLNVVPLFYPCPTNEPQKHSEWLPLILRWLHSGWTPYENQEETRTEQVLTSDYFRYIHNNRANFQDFRGILERLLSFINARHSFLWREFCGLSDSGKTRWLSELRIKACSFEWDVHFFDMETYEDFLTRDISMANDTLLIFDDADRYEVSAEDRTGDTYNDIPNFDDSFLLSVKNLIKKTSPEHKLRIIFVFTSHKSDRNTNANYWWTKCSHIYHPFAACRIPGNALMINWTTEDFKIFVHNFIMQHHKDQDDSHKNKAIRTFEAFCEENKHTLSPLICMIHIDAFFDDRDFDDVLKSLVEQLTNEKRGLRTSKSAINEFIMIIKDDVYFFHKHGRRSKLNIVNETSDSKHKNQRDDQGMSKLAGGGNDGI